MDDIEILSGRTPPTHAEPRNKAHGDRLQITYDREQRRSEADDAIPFRSIRLRVEGGGVPQTETFGIGRILTKPTVV